MIFIALRHHDPILQLAVKAGPRIGALDFTTETCQTFQQLNRFMNCVCLLYKQNMSGISLFGDMLTEVKTHQKSNMWKLKEPGNPRISNVGCDLLRSCPSSALPWHGYGSKPNGTIPVQHQKAAEWMFIPQNMTWSVCWKPIVQKSEAYKSI